MWEYLATPDGGHLRVAGAQFPLKLRRRDFLGGLIHENETAA